MGAPAASTAPPSPQQHFPKNNQSINQNNNLTFVWFRREIWWDQNSWMCCGGGLGMRYSSGCSCDSRWRKVRGGAAARTEVWSGSAAEAAEAALERRC